MAQQFMKTGTLALLQVVIVGNLQTLPANAIYGFSLPFLYLVAGLCFYLPCTLMTAKLAIIYPQTGGAYIWCEKAFGQKIGFMTIALLWISNLLWYPSIFALITANLAYLFNAALAQNKFFIITSSLLFFWFITSLNCLGIKFSIRMSTLGSIVGIIFPMLVIMLCGIIWWFSGKIMAISLSQTPLIPDFTSWQSLSYVIAVMISLFGIEVMAVHAGDVIKPAQNFPRSLLMSSILLFILLISAEVAIAIIVPTKQLNVLTGLLDALNIFFQQLGLNELFLFIIFLVFLGNIGSVGAWMMGSTRGMYVACKRNDVHWFLQIINRYNAPVGVLLFEAVIFTIASGVFLLFPNVMDSFWLLLVLASQVTLIYYIILFFSAMRLGCNKILMALGAFSSFIALLLGFIPPPDLNTQQIYTFLAVISAGLIFAVGLPLLFLYSQKISHRKNTNLRQ